MRGTLKSFVLFLENGTVPVGINLPGLKYWFDIKKVEDIYIKKKKSMLFSLLQGMDSFLRSPVQLRALGAN